MNGPVNDVLVLITYAKPHRCHYVVSLSKNINPSLVLVQPRRIRPFITERLLMGRKESNKKKTNHMQNSLLKTPMLTYLAGLLPLRPEPSSIPHLMMASKTPKQMRQQTSIVAFGGNKWLGSMTYRVAWCGTVATLFGLSCVCCAVHCKCPL